MPRQKKAVVKSTSVDKCLESAIENLTAAYNDGGSAIIVQSKEGKKLAAEVRKLSKKRMTLMRRKKTSAARVKTAPSVETRKALRLVEKEVATVAKALQTVKAQKTVVSTELAALKANQRKAAAYMKAMERADKVLNKPKKKRRKRRAKKAV